ESQTVAVRSPFAKQLKLASDWVIPPATLLKFNAPNVASRGAAVHAIQPAVRSPREVVGHGLGVLHAKPREQNLGIAVGHVVSVVVGIEQQIRHVDYKHAAMAKGQTGGQIQSI